MASRGRKPKVKQIENTLLTALQFVSVTQRNLSQGAPEITHCRLTSNWIMASNGILAAAHSVSEALSACPHTFTLIEALERASGPVMLTQPDSTRLQIRSGEFSVDVPCLDAEKLPMPCPDAAAHLCDDRLKVALSSVGTLVAESAEKIVATSVQVRNGSCIASNGTVILEAWHSLDTPVMLIPKAFVIALGKIAKPIHRMGWSEKTFTVWYEDNSWLQTQLYPADTAWPDLLTPLEWGTGATVPTPKSLFEVAEKLEPFAKDSRGGIIFFKEGTAWTLDNNASESAKDVPNLGFYIRDLKLIKPFAQSIRFNASPGISLFFGDNIRGAIVQV